MDEVMSDIENRIAEVLAAHELVARGMTGQTPDRCTCEERVYPYPQADREEIIERRQRAFATHQAAMLLPLIAVAWDEGRMAGSGLSVSMALTRTNPYDLGHP